MKRLLGLDCYISNQEAILEEQFGKLTKKEQKKVHAICLICMHGHRSISKLVQGNGLALGGGGQPLGGCLQNKLHSRLKYSKLQSNFYNNLSVCQGGRSCAGARVAPAEKFGLGRKF